MRIWTMTLAGAAGTALLLAACVSPGAGRTTGPWDVAELTRPPAATWGATNGLLQEVYYAGAPYQGRPTRVFAYYGRPAGDGPFPAVLLVHGGGGKAFPAWAEHWAKRGYVALAMDTAGCGPAGRLPDGGPDQSDEIKFLDFTPDTVHDMWTYHAIAAVLRGHGLLKARPEVDARRVAVTGISWGGYLTCIVAGLDRDLRAAVPVYGCGFLHENSYWLDPQFARMTEDRRLRWVDHFDPSRYLGAARCPMLFVNGTTDFAYPLDSYRKSYRLAAAPVTLSVAINRPHGHIWTFPEVDAFIDHHLEDAPGLPQLSEMNEAVGRVSARFTSPSPLARAEFCFTHDTGPWPKRRWESVPATLADGRVTADLPARRPLVGYLRATDGRGLAVSTPHLEWE